MSNAMTIPAAIPAMPESGMTRHSTVPDDVLSVLMANAETQIRDEIRKLEQEYNLMELGNRKASSDRRLAFKRMVEIEAQEEGKKYVEALMPTLRLLKGAASIEASQFWPTIKQPRLMAYVTIGYRSGNNKGNKVDTNEDVASLAFEFKPSKELAVIIKEERDAGMKLGAIRAKITDYKKKLTDLPTLERKYRSDVALARLKAQAGGEEILKELGKRMGQDIAQLGG
jgi:hypothetical protein